MHSLTRRVALGVLAASTSLTLRPPRQVIAAKGAAEMDLEFYVRGLIGKAPSPPAAPQAIAEPRRLNPAFSAGAIEAVESSIAVALGKSPSALREAAAERRRSLSLEYNRVLTTGAFGLAGYDAAAAVVLSLTRTRREPRLTAAVVTF